MNPRIVVLGAGYAGAPAAVRLAARLPRAQITLVNATDRFVERIRMHQLAAGQPIVGTPLQKVVAGTGIELVIARVAGIDVEAKTVQLEGERPALQYDVLIYALGSFADFGGVRGVREHALGVADAEHAGQLRDQLDRHAAARIAVIGGGLTGIETAAELAEARRDRGGVVLVSAGLVGGWLSSRARAHLIKGLERLGVTVRENAPVKAVDATGLELGEGERLDADAVVWAAGFRVPDIAARAGLAVDDRGRMLLDATLRSSSHPDVFGAGDAVAAMVAGGGGESRMSAQTAVPMGAQVADAVARSVTGRSPRSVKVLYVWQHISLGRRDGVTQFTHLDDSPLGLVLTGRPSAHFKELICRGVRAYCTRHAALFIRPYRATGS